LTSSWCWHGHCHDGLYRSYTLNDKKLRLKSQYHGR
jgi:hypothetical protein